MNKEDWQSKEKEFIEMLKNSEDNMKNVLNQIEELKIFLETVRGKIKTFK